MAAEFKIIKYTGKSSDFGTEVANIGIKRIDAAVPAVYGNPVVAANDQSDASMYSVHKPENEDEFSYSFESIFKLKLKNAPDNQLSNIRIYTSTISEISVSIVEVSGELSVGDKIVGVTSNAVGTVMSKSSTGSIMNINVTSGEFIVNEVLTNEGGNTVSITSIDTITGSNNNDSDKTPKIYIGTSQTYSIPTNVKSLIATDDLMGYTSERPFPVPVGGVTGGEVNPDIAVLTHNLTLNDIGTGNLIYVNNVRQDDIIITQDTNNLYTLLDQTSGLTQYALYSADAVDGDLPIITTVTPGIVDTDLESGVDGQSRNFIKITSTTALHTLYPNGFIYAKYDVTDAPTFDDDVNVGTLQFGGEISWVDLDGDPIETVEYDVRVETAPNGKPYYTFDGVRQLTLNFELNRIYVFNNLNGDTEPLRFIDTANDIMATEENIITDGVSVVDGATANEVITVRPREVLSAGKEILGYQSVNTCEIGGKVNNIDFVFDGNYNLNTVGGGTNPEAAGETDYIYLQIEVAGDSNTGDYVPEVIIEYDEN